MNLSTLLSQLRDRPSGHTFTVVPVAGFQSVLLGADIAGHPVLFVKAEEGTFEPPLRTDRVSLHIGHSYNLAGMEECPRSELLHALRCEASEPPEVETFLVLLEAFLEHHGAGRVNLQDLKGFFRSLVRLFAVSPAKDLLSERRGLWGELFMMSRVRGFQFWAPFWHSEVSRRFDFSYGPNRLEVKFTTRSERIHYFTHRQIYSSGSEDIFIASIVAGEDDSGLSLRQLIQDSRRDLLGSPDYIKLEKAVRHAGMEDPAETGPVIDASEAEASIAWFRSIEVPHFRVPEPQGVSETRYKVDLSNSPRIAAADTEAWLGTWCLEPLAGSTIR